MGIQTSIGRNRYMKRSHKIKKEKLQCKNKKKLHNINGRYTKKQNVGTSAAF
jgi:hypothetical protein